MRELIFAALLLVAGVCVVVGATVVYSAAGWIVGGVLLAVWAWLVLADDGPRS